MAVLGDCTCAKVIEDKLMALILLAHASTICSHRREHEKRWGRLERSKQHPGFTSQ